MSATLTGKIDRKRSRERQIMSYLQSLNYQETDEMQSSADSLLDYLEVELNIKS